MRTLSAVLLAGSLVVLGCSGGGDTTGNGGNTSTSTGTSSTTSYPITAAAGGTVTAPGVTVVIPPGALAADTTITLTVSDKTGQPNAGTIAASIFDFGPNGTTFLKPVSMTLDFTGTPAAGEVAKLAYLEGGAWVPLADSAATGTQVTATTTHFTPFTVVFGAGGQTGGSCLTFTPCGGDIVGTWTYTAGCYDLPAALNPYPTCPGATLSATFDITGSVEFKADGTYAQTGTQGMTMTIEVPKSCLGGACPSSGKTTWVDAGATCKGTEVQAPTPNTSSGTFSTASNQVTLDVTGADGGVAMKLVGDYCVTGNSMDVAFPDPAQGTKAGYKLTK